MFRGKIKGRKRNDQVGVGRKKAVNLKCAKTALQQMRENAMLPHYTGPSAALLKSFSYLGPALAIGFSLCSPS